MIARLQKIRSTIGREAACKLVHAAPRPTERDYLSAAARSDACMPWGCLVNEPEIGRGVPNLE